MEQKSTIAYDDFAKLDLRIGVVLSAEAVPESRKLLKLMVDIGEAVSRQIIAGLKKSYEDPRVLVGKQVLVLVNLEPKELAGLTSHGMLIAATGEGNLPIYLTSGDISKTKAGNEVH